MSDKSTDNWFARVRRAFIDHHAATHGRINRGDLIAAFGISQSQASADLNHYIREFPGAFKYDLTAKTYHWTGGSRNLEAPPPIVGFE